MSVCFYWLCALSDCCKCTRAAAFVPRHFSESKARRTPKEKEDVVRISGTLVQVDAVVTDAKGRYITYLRPEDFELFEDNRYGFMIYNAQLNPATKQPQLDTQVLLLKDD